MDDSAPTWAAPTIEPTIEPRVQEDDGTYFDEDVFRVDSGYAPAIGLVRTQ